MQFHRTSQQTKWFTKLPLQGYGVIADNIKATALWGAFKSKSGNDHMAALFHGAADLVVIGGAVAGRNEKMKDGAVMPHIVSGRFQRDLSDIRNQPMDVVGGSSQSFSVRIDGGL